MKAIQEAAARQLGMRLFDVDIKLHSPVNPSGGCGVYQRTVRL